MADKLSESDRALFERLSRRPSLVARERPSWGFTVALGAIAVGGLILFLSLDAARTAQPAVVTSDVVRPSPAAPAAAVGALDDCAVVTPQAASTAAPAETPSPRRKLRRDSFRSVCGTSSFVLPLCVVIATSYIGILYTRHSQLSPKFVLRGAAQAAANSVICGRSPALPVSASVPSAWVTRTSSW
jgi:hypothetical protein